MSSYKGITIIQSSRRTNINKFTETINYEVDSKNFCSLFTVIIYTYIDYDSLLQYAIPYCVKINTKKTDSSISPSDRYFWRKNGKGDYDK